MSAEFDIEQYRQNQRNEDAFILIRNVNDIREAYAALMRRYNRTTKTVADKEHLWTVCWIVRQELKRARLQLAGWCDHWFDLSA